MNEPPTMFAGSQPDRVGESRSRFRILILSGMFALACVSVCVIRMKAHEAARIAEVERRDEWIANTVASLKSGQSSVSLYSCINTDVMLEKLAGMHEVQSVAFIQTHDLTQNGMLFLPKLPNLRQLNFHGEKALTDETIAIVARCGKLETLDIKACKVTDAGLEAVATISSLRRFSHDGHFGQTALDALAAKLPDLKIAGFK